MARTNKTMTATNRLGARWRRVDVIFLLCNGQDFATSTQHPGEVVQQTTIATRSLIDRLQVALSPCLSLMYRWKASRASRVIYCDS